ncbi:MAG: ABC transporter permease [Deltaproteobacteria bacterium]|nr:ABC transporter permease [Deltaproteobacteria bacterium]
MASLWLDLRYALRMMVKSPGLTAVLAITLALGIGASTTIFSVVNSVILRPLPYERPEELVRIYTEFNSKLALKKFWISPPEFDDLRRECRTCASVAAWAPGTASFAGGDRPVRVEAAYATHELLPLLGVRPALGRWFDASEDRPGDPTVVVLGHRLWERAFGADPNIVGRKITLDAMPVTVIGVMPAGFDFLDRQEAWVPLCFDWAKGRRGNHYLNVIARLGPGQTIFSLRQELVSLLLGWDEKRTPNTHALGPYLPVGNSHPMIAEPFHEDLVGSLSTTLWLLQGAVLLVLLISIVNVANLLLARAETRTREVAVRHALGASRRRLLRQFVTESLLLGILGGALGVLVAVWAIDGVRALIPASAPRAAEIALDGRAVVFAVACAIGAALLFGLAPIIHARRSDLHGALKDGSPRMTGSRARLRVRRGLVIAEVALAVVLVISCTVTIRSFLKLQKVEPGFDPEHLLTFELEIPEKTYPGVTGDVFWSRVQQRMKALPGVSHVTLIDGLPPARPINANDLSFPGRVRPPPGGVIWNVDYWNVFGDDAIATLGLRLVRGRAFSPSDTLTAPGVVLINESFANKFFPGEDPIGQRMQINGEGPDRPVQTVVGVVADLKQAGIDKPAGTELFVPVSQYSAGDAPARSPPSLYVVIRTDHDPAELTQAVYRAVAEIDPSLPISKLRTMDDVMWEAVARPRFLAFLLTSFAVLALLLAAVGVYGVMAHTVAQRTHEIGLRVALGARPAQVRAMVLRQAGTLIAGGIVIGLAGAMGLQGLLGPSLTGLFYGDALSQPLMLGGVSIAVAAAALLATWLPVRRATRVQPTVALRSE